jgi:hypothetical protein
VDSHLPGPRPSSARSDRQSLDRFSFPSSSSDSLEQYRDTSRVFQYPRGHGGFSTPQISRGQGSASRVSLGKDKGYSFSGSMNEERYSVGGSYRGVTDSEKGFTPRPEPDGQSDISSTSPDILRQRQYQRSPYHSVLSTPPCTPIPADGREVLVTPITPAMLQSALDALEGIEDKDTPLSLTPRRRFNSDSRSAVLPETVTQALTKWISSQSLTTSGGPSHSSLKTTPLLTPPPSTPESTPTRSGSAEPPGSQGISAGDLIAALSTLKVSGTPGSRGSGGPTVPACTPNEVGGGIEEWAKLGIRPAAVIQALSALTIQQVCWGRGGRDYFRGARTNR